METGGGRKPFLLEKIRIARIIFDVTTIAYYGRYCLNENCLFRPYVRQDRAEYRAIMT